MKPLLLFKYGGICDSVLVQILKNRVFPIAIEFDSHACSVWRSSTYTWCVESAWSDDEHASTKKHAPARRICLERLVLSYARPQLPI